MQEETAESDEFQFTISSIELPPKCKRGCLKGSKNYDLFIKEKAKGWSCCIWQYVTRTKGEAPIVMVCGNR